MSRWGLLLAQVPSFLSSDIHRFHDRLFTTLTGVESNTEDSTLLLLSQYKNTPEIAIAMYTGFLRCISKLKNYLPCLFLRCSFARYPTTFGSAFLVKLKQLLFR
jgi:hypothetical protein